METNQFEQCSAIIWYSSTFLSQTPKASERCNLSLSTLWWKLLIAYAVSSENYTYIHIYIDCTRYRISLSVLLHLLLRLKTTGDTYITPQLCNVLSRCLVMEKGTILMKQLNNPQRSVFIRLDPKMTLNFGVIIVRTVTAAIKIRWECLSMNFNAVHEAFIEMLHLYVSEDGWRLVDQKKINL